MKGSKTDRNGDIHNSGIDNPDFALDNPFAISTSDGHDEDWEFFPLEEKATERFEFLKKFENDMHLYKYNKEYGYEVIDSFSDEEF